MKTKPKLKPHRKPNKVKRQLSDKEIQIVTGCIVNSYINNFYLTEADYLGIFQKSAKYNVNRTKEDLLRIEKNFFDTIDALDEANIIDKLVANRLAFVDWLLNKYSFNDFSMFEEYALAHNKDWQSMKERADEINNRIKS